MGLPKSLSLSPPLSLSADTFAESAAAGAGQHISLSRKLLTRRRHTWYKDLAAKINRRSLSKGATRRCLRPPHSRWHKSWEWGTLCLERPVREKYLHHTATFWENTQWTVHIGYDFNTQLRSHKKSLDLLSLYLYILGSRKIWSFVCFYSKTLCLCKFTFKICLFFFFNILKSSVLDFIPKLKVANISGLCSISILGLRILVDQLFFHD